jgi:hypothetical protein
LETPHVDVSPVDLPAARLGEKLLEVRLAFELFDLDPAHVVQVVPYALQAPVVIPAHAL